MPDIGWQVIHPIAAAAVGKFGVQPATTVVGIFDTLALEVEKKIPNVKEKVEKGGAANIAGSLYNPKRASSSEAA